MRKHTTQFPRRLAAGLAALSFAAAVPAFGASSWEGTDINNPWWYDPTNWSDGLRSDTDLRIGNGFDYDGDGVVFDPENDPNITGTAPSVNPFDAYRLYTGYPDNSSTGKLTIKSGTLHFSSYARISRGTLSESIVVQEGGTLIFDGTDPLFPQFPDYSQGNVRIGDGGGSLATYEYRGGTLITSDRIRLANGTASTARFIVHNPTNGGKIAIGFENQADFVVSENTSGVATVEFHYANGGTRVIQVGDQLSLRNNDADPATRSARLELVLDEAPIVDGALVPNNLALFTTVGGVIGEETNVARFYNADGSAYYDQGDIISAEFGGETYNWTISYEGDVVLSDAENSVLSSISATGGNDVVLIGHSSTVPEPAAIALLGAGGLCLLGRRH